MIDAAQKTHNEYRNLGKSQENIARIPHIEHFHPINYVYSDLITFSFKTKTQYSAHNDPQKPDKSAN
jgi:hypothetical protein